MSADRKMDFRYAVENTEILIPPSGMLETFGNTLLDYILVSESMDSIDSCHIRTGRMKLQRPQIITPAAYSQMLLEGFGEEARKYVQWLAEHEEDVHILRYGYTLKRESFSEETVSRPIEAILQDAANDVRSKKDPYLALVRGMDDPWDVCLVRLFWEVVRNSARKNIYDMAKQHLFEHKQAGLSREARQEIESAFSAAARDSSLIQQLGALLQKHNVFEVYEDRFFELVNRRRTS